MTLLSFARAAALQLCSVHSRRIVVAVSLVAVILPSPIRAVDHTWNGGGITDDWNDAGNWTSILAPPTAPTGFGSELRFFFTGSKSTSNIDVPWKVTDIVFNSGVTAMTFSGSALTLTAESSGTEGIINNDGSTQTFSNSEVIFESTANTYVVTAASGNLDFNAKISVSDAITLNVGGSNDVFFDGGIVKTNSLAGVMTVNKTGSGELRLRDNSTGIEQLNISGGLVLLSQTNNPTISSTLNVNISSGVFNLNGNNANIDVLTGFGSVALGSGRLILGEDASQDASFTYSGVISGTGGITKDKDGELVLAGSNTYTGFTSIDNGTLQLNGSGQISDASDVSIFGPATFDLNGVSDTVDSIQGAGTIRLGGANLTVDETAGSRFFDGDILESGELTKNNGGTLVLTGSNEFTTLDINGGTLQASNAAALGLGSIELGNATLQTTSTYINSRPISLGSTLSKLSVNSGTTLTQSGVMSGAGAMNKQGTGTLVLNASNSYTGDTVVTAGTVRLNASNRIGNLSDVIMSTGATLDLDNRTDTVASLSGTGGTVDTGGSAGRLTVNAASGTFPFGGEIIGDGGLTKSGSHTLTLNGNNSYTGSTSITGGVLQLGTHNRISNDSDVSLTGGTFDLNNFFELVDSISGSGGIIDLGSGTLIVDENSASPKSFSGAIIGTGSFIKNGFHQLTLSGNNTYTGTTTMDAGVLRVASSSNLGSGGLIFDNGTLNTTGTFINSRSVSINANDSATFDVNTSTFVTQTGVITGASTTTLIKTGGGRLVLEANNAFTGDVTVSDGILEFRPGNVLGDTTTTVTVNSPGSITTTFPETIGGLAGSGNVNLNIGFLEVGGNNLSTIYTGTISGIDSFRKSGTGTFTTSGSHTHTGGTFINAGTWRLTGGGLTDTGDVTVNGTWDLNDVSDAIDALTGGGTVMLGAGGANSLTVGSNNGGGTFSGSITEAGGFIKVGAGTQTLSGSNSWTAGTQINGGVLRIGSSSNLGSGQISIDGGTLESTGSLTNFRSISLGSGGGTLDVNSGTTFTMGAATPITGVGALTKSDTGNLILTANNTYTGDTNINSGMLILAGSGRLSDLTDVIVAGGATWDLNGISDTVKSIAGAGNIVINGGTLTVNQDGGATTFSGAVTDPGGITKEGSHTLTFSGLNDYEGPTTINEGILQITEDFHLGEPASDLVFGGGTLYLLPGTPMVFDAGRSITLNAGGGPLFGTIFLEAGSQLTVPGVISGPGALDVFSDNEEFLVLSGVNSYLGGTTIFEAIVEVSQNANLGDNGGSVTLNNGGLQTTATFTNQHAVVLDGGGFIDVDAGTLTQSAGISGVGPLSIFGPGTMVLTAPATHAGNTSIDNNATLRFGSGELPDAFDVEVADGIWDLNGVSDTINGLDGEGTVLLGGGTLTVGFADGDGNFCGSIQEAGNFVKTGSGTQILDGNNTYTGSTTIDEGTLAITSDGSLGAASATLVFNDGTLRTTTTFTTGRTTTINTIGEFDTVGGATLTFSSPIDGGANADLVKSGTGTLVLTQPSTFGGMTEITEGTLQLSGGGLLPSSGVDVFTGATLDSTDVSDTIGRLLGGGDVLLGLGTLTIGADNLGGTFNGIISGVGGAIVKIGAGTEVFSGINTYTGTTFINGGVLQVSAVDNLGEVGNLISFDGGTLRTTASFSTVRGISLNVGDGTFDVDTATTLDAAGLITGLGSLTKIGDGTLVLSGFSTYEGGTNINGGVVEISSSFNLGNTLGTLTLDNGTLHTTNNITTSRLTVIGPGAATFDTDGSTTLTLSGLISGNAGANGLTKAGAGTFRLQAANTFSAATKIAGGLLQVDASNQLGDGGNTIDLVGGSLNTLASLTNARVVRIGVGGGGINVAAGTTLTQSGVIQDDTIGPFGGLAKDGAGTLLSTASNTYSGSTAINAGTLQLGGAGQLPDVTDVSVAGAAFFDLNNVSDTIDALTGSGDVTLGSGTLTVGSDDGGGTYSGTISGAGGLVKIGDGTQTLRFKPDGIGGFLPNTYVGGTAINGGVLDVEQDNSLGDPAGALSFDGGTLQVQGVANSVNGTRAVTLKPGGGTVNTVGMGDSVTFGGGVGGTGALTKNGLGTLTLTASNTYAGNTSVVDGILRLSGAGQLPDTSTVSVEASGIMGEGFDMNNVSDAVDGISGAGDIHLGSGTLTIGSANGGDEFDGSIDGTGGLVKVGTGAQIINEASTYTGGTALNGGLLEINADNRLGDPSGSLSFDGGTLQTSGTFSMARATTMNAGGGTFVVPGANTLTHTTVISGSGGLGKSNAGTMILAGINTYTGPTNITGGTLQLGGIERLANVTAVSVSGGATFDLNNFNESIDAISGAGSIQLGTAQLIVGLDNGSGTFGGVLSGGGDLLKEGTGTQTLTGANTYSGSTFVERGELVLSGGGSISQTTLLTGFGIGSDGITTVDGASTTWDLSGNLFVGFDGTGRMNITGGATVTVDGGATIGGGGGAGTLSLDGGTLDNSAGTVITVTTGALQGHGTILGNVLNQDTVAPGNSAGILALTGNYIQDTTGLFSIEIGGTDNSDPQNPQFDFFDISGTASLLGLLELALIDGFTPAQPDTFTVLTASSLAGVFSNVANGARLDIVSGGTGSFQVDYTATSLILSDFQGVGGSIPGDFNGDGVVDGNDLAQWEGDFGVSGDSDSDGDGDSDGKDFLIWQQQVGNGVPSTATSQTVPEPAAGLMLMLGMAAMLFRRDRVVV